MAYVSRRNLQDCGKIPTFRMAMLPPSSGWRLQHDIVTQHCTRHRNPENLDVSLHRRENLKPGNRMMKRILEPKREKEREREEV